MVNLMTEDDNIALVKFNSAASVINGLTKMTESNKKTIINNINTKLVASGGTQIYYGLQSGLQQITKNYANGDRICSIILLSDGQDGSKNADTNFKSYIASQRKNDYIFSLDTIGYGNSHDAVLMKKLQLLEMVDISLLKN
jgi:Mg-chelatase subunit ChlD